MQGDCVFDYFVQNGMFQTELIGSGDGLFNRACKDRRRKGLHGEGEEAYAGAEAESEGEQALGHSSSPQSGGRRRRWMKGICDTEDR